MATINTLNDPQIKHSQFSVQCLSWNQMSTPRRVLLVAGVIGLIASAIIGSKIGAVLSIIAILLALLSSPCVTNFLKNHIFTCWKEAKKAPDKIEDKGLHYTFAQSAEATVAAQTTENYEVPPEVTLDQEPLDVYEDPKTETEEEPAFTIETGVAGNAGSPGALGDDPLATLGKIGEVTHTLGKSGGLSVDDPSTLGTIKRESAADDGISNPSSIETPEKLAELRPVSRGVLTQALRKSNAMSKLIIEIRTLRKVLDALSKDLPSSSRPRLAEGGTFRSVDDHSRHYQSGLYRKGHTLQVRMLNTEITRLKGEIRDFSSDQIQSVQEQLGVKINL